MKWLDEAGCRIVRPERRQVGSGLGTKKPVQHANCVDEALKLSIHQSINPSVVGQLRPERCMQRHSCYPIIMTFFSVFFLEETIVPTLLVSLQMLTGPPVAQR